MIVYIILIILCKQVQLSHTVYSIQGIILLYLVYTIGDRFSQLQWDIHEGLSLALEDLSLVAM